jgi:hypothetical protein
VLVQMPSVPTREDVYVDKRVVQIPSSLRASSFALLSLRSRRCCFTGIISLYLARWNRNILVEMGVVKDG